MIEVLIIGTVMLVLGGSFFWWLGGKMVDAEEERIRTAIAGEVVKPDHIAEIIAYLEDIDDGTGS